MPHYNAKAVINMLKEKGMYITQNRIEVLKVLIQYKSPVTIAMIIKSSAILLDRVSVYRTLQLFMANSLVHSLPSRNGHARYLLWEEENIHEEASPKLSSCFVCIKCSYTEHIPRPAFKPGEINHDYTIYGYNLVIEGLCDECSEKERREKNKTHGKTE